MKIAPLAVSLLLTPTLVLAQNWGAGLNDAVLRSTDKDSGFHFQRVNLRSDDHDMIRLVAKTAPAVVMIGVTGKAQPEADDQDGQSQAPDLPPDIEKQLRDFLQKQEPQDGQSPQAPVPDAPVQPQAGPHIRIIPMPMPGQGEPDKPQIEHGTGSGVIVSFGGRKLIVTNNHVVEIAGTGAEVDLKFFDGTIGKGTVLGRNERYDLAFVEPASLCRGCRAMPLTTSVQEGEFTMAIGAPFALYNTKTTGIVSFKGRSLDEGSADDLVSDFIQTSAAINPGNSGGALVDRLGRLMGINTAIYSPTHASVGIGFATPAKYVLHLAARYAATGVIAPSRIGMVVGPDVMKDADGKPQLDRFGNIVTGAVKVQQDPQAGTPAAAAGFKKGDELVSLNGRPVKSHTAFVRAIADLVPGQKAVIVVKRGDETLTLASDVVAAHD